MLSSKQILKLQSSDYCLGYSDALSDALGLLGSGEDIEKIKEKMRTKIEECDELI